MHIHCKMLSKGQRKRRLEAAVWTLGLPGRSPQQTYLALSLDRWEAAYRAGTFVHTARLELEG